MSVSQNSPNCPHCGDLRTILKIRALVGAKASEDVVAAVYRLKVWHDIYQQWIEHITKKLGDKLPASIDALKEYTNEQTNSRASGQDDCNAVRGEDVATSSREGGDGPSLCDSDERRAAEIQRAIIDGSD